MEQGKNTDLDLQTFLSRSKGLVAADIDGEVAVMTIDSGKYHSLNETGSLIWSLLEEPRRVADVCESLEREFQVEPEQCRADVMAYLQDMLAERLLEVTEEVTDAVAA